MTGWTVWVDVARDVHVVAVLDVTPMQAGDEPSPWHQFDAACPCQPRVINEDLITRRRTVGHQDPVQ